jgi:imidazolonepropionase-like amidohydrolase
MGTSAPAAFVREPGKFGIVAAGASADLMLVDANPLADVGNAQKISGVLVRGRWLSRQFIDDGLNEIQRRVATAAEFTDSP